MTQIRKRSIIVTIWIYFGFLIGAVNTILFANKFFFEQEQYGLTRSLVDIAIMLSAFAAMGAPMYLLKFHPYYKKRLPEKNNDLLANGFLFIMIGFIIVLIGSILIKPLIIQKYIEKAPLLVDYFYWSLPLAFGFLLFSLLDGYAWNYGLQLLTNILKEVVLRIYVLLIILIYLLKLITIDQFFILFALQYILVCAILMYKLYTINALHFHFKWSFVTVKFKKQIRSLMLFGFAASVVGAIKIAFDSIVLSSLVGLTAAAKYSFVGFAASLLQAPFRSMISISFPILVLAWKEKNMAEIEKIYKRSSINLLLFSLFIFGIIWLNFEHAIYYLNLKADFVNGKWTLLVLCIAYIIEMGTGLNAQIIQSSTMWRFEFFTNLLLAFIIAPFTYIFTKMTGLIGPAFATLLGYIIYNLIRIIFLYKRYRLFPFTLKTLYAIVGFTGILFLSIWSNSFIHGFIQVIISNFIFISLFTFGVLYFNITPDVKPVFNNVLKRLGIQKKLF